MSSTMYRRRAILSRIHQALDAFYLLQRIDWEYDIRETLRRIMGLALDELEFEGGQRVEQAMIILEGPDGQDFEAQAGWKAGDPELTFSRTVVQQTVEKGEPILCENAKDDPRFMEAESIKNFETLSLISVPLLLEDTPIGAFYIESKSPGDIFEVEDLEFLEEFARTVTPYLKAAITHQDHVQEIRKLREEVTGRYQLGNIIGRSESIQGVFELIKIAADIDRTVLITGESGCGKELVAKAIHYNGQRREGNFVVVDCSSLAEHLLESELFGHRRGAFTGASHDKVGAFEAANDGTLFLDEISDASKPLQQKLRRVLQEGEIRRVGDNEVHRVDVRVICASNRDLGDLVKKGEFQRDLYYRINKFPIQIPPLRERREDIPLLVHHFLERASRPGLMAPSGIQGDAMELLMSFDWAENNIRQLRNTVELAADFAQGGIVDRPLIERILKIQSVAPPDHRAAISGIGLTEQPGGIVQIQEDEFRRLLAQRQHQPASQKEPKASTPFYRLQLEFSARMILEALRFCDWKLRPAGRLLGISPMKLRGELKEYLRSTLVSTAGDADRAADVLGIPREILEKKTADLGLDDLLERSQAE